MRIEGLVWTEDAELHILCRHNVTPPEVEEAVRGLALIVRGRQPGIYEIFGRSGEGRYLTTVVRSLGKGAALLITCRNMTRAERRRYSKWAAH